MDKEFKGTTEDFIKILDMMWWDERYRQILRLQSDIGYDIFESLPSEIQYQLMGYFPDWTDKDNNLLFKKHVGKEGERYEIRCSQKHYRKVKKLDKQVYKECRNLVFCLSSDPTGCTLPKSHNPKYFHSYDERTRNRIQLQYGIPAEKTSYSYQIGEYRAFWYIDSDEKSIDMFEFTHRNTVGKKLN